MILGHKKPFRQNRPDILSAGEEVYEKEIVAVRNCGQFSSFCSLDAFVWPHFICEKKKKRAEKPGCKFKMNKFEKSNLF